MCKDSTESCLNMTPVFAHYSWNLEVVIDVETFDATILFFGGYSNDRPKSNTNNSAAAAMNEHMDDLLDLILWAGQLMEQRWHQCSFLMNNERIT